MNTIPNETIALLLRTKSIQAERRQNHIYPSPHPLDEALEAAHQAELAKIRRRLVEIDAKKHAATLAK